MADFKTLNVNNGTWDVKDEVARNDIATINNTIDNTITPSLATLNSTKASHTDLSNAIGALDYTDAAESGKYVSEVSETDGVISVTRADINPYIDAKIAALDYSDTAVSGQYVSEVSETDGVISVTRASLPTKLSDFTDDVVAGNYQPICSTSSTSASNIELTANASTAACEMSVPKGLNVIRIGVAIPNDVTNTDFTAIFSTTSGASSYSAGTAQHQYIGNPVGSGRTILDFIYTGLFNSDTTFYCNIMHNNANNISVPSVYFRTLTVPM